MLRICVFTRSTPHHLVGGMEIISWNLAKKFVQKGHQVKLITTSISNRPETFKEEGIDVVALAGTPPGKYSKAWGIKSLAYFQTIETDIIFSISAGAYGLLPYKSDLKIPFIMQLHGTSWSEILAKIKTKDPYSWIKLIKNFYTLPIDIFNISKFDALVAVGPRVYDDLHKFPFNLTVNSNKIRIIVNGIDNRIFNTTGADKISLRDKFRISKDSKLLMTACRLHTQKGVDNILNSFSKLLKRRTDVFLIVAGDGPDKEKLISLCGKLNLDKRVFFVNSVSQTELGNMLKSSDLFIFLTNRIEGLPLNILEALSSGLNCIISEHLDIFESKMIHKINPKDFRKVSEKISYLLDQGAVAVSSIPENYTLDYSADQYLQLFESLRSNY